MFSLSDYFFKHKFLNYLCIGVVLLVQTAVTSPGQEIVERGLRRKAVSDLAGRQTSDPDFYLLVIAVDDYQYWPELTTPVSDAKALSELLQKEYLFDPARTTMLLNQDATQSGIEAALRKLEAQTGANDSLMIYYAGHGHKDGYWIPYDGEVESRTRWISTRSIKEYMRTIPARHILLASDSCFSGGFIMRGIKTVKSANSQMPQMPHQLRTLYNRKSRFALTSGGNEPVKDSGVSKDHSVFAYFLLHALKVNQAPFLIPADENMFGSIRSGVLANPLAPGAEQTPGYGEMIDTGSSSGQFVFFRKNYDPMLTKSEVRPVVRIGFDEPQQESTDRDELELPDFDNNVRLLITNPTSGKIRVGRGKTLDLTGATRLSLSEGRHKFAMRLDTGEKIGGILTVHEVDTEASVTMFGFKRGIFFQPSHIQAVREGRPVRYSVRLDGEMGERDVISYIMSLQN